MSKHVIKVFFKDGDEGYYVDDDGSTITITQNKYSAAEFNAWQAGYKSGELEEFSQVSFTSIYDL